MRKIENLTTYRVNDTHKYFEFLQKVEDIRVEVYNNLIDELIQEIERRESSQKSWWLYTTIISKR